MQTERYTVNPAKVVHETIEGEAIVIQLESGFYYSLQGTGAEIWELLAGGSSLGDVVHALTPRYAADGATIAGAVERLAGELATEGLLEQAPEGALAAGGNGASLHGRRGTTPFEPPVLNRYTDMQDFLLVDPIHETSEAGWPERQPGA